jgi:hypothetical protein
MWRYDASSQPLTTRRFSFDRRGKLRKGEVHHADFHVYSAQAIDVMILPYSDPSRIADGSHIADWLVSSQLAIKYVIWRAQIWTPDEDWHPYEHPSGSTDPTLLHMDHIHVSVH